MSTLPPKKGFNRHHILPCLRYFSKEYGNNIYNEFDEEDCIYMTIQEHTSLHIKISGNPMCREEVRLRHREKMRTEGVRVSIGNAVSSFRNNPLNADVEISRNKKISNKMKGQNNPMFGIGVNNPKCLYGDNYRCIETGTIIHNKFELKEFTQNPKAVLSNVRKSVLGVRDKAYGYHWEIEKGGGINEG